MTIDLGSIRIDDKYLWRQLKNDLGDDWFPDPKHYDDMFSNDRIRDDILKNFEENHGQYVPSRRSVSNVPKSNFTIRSALETSIQDRAVYHGLASHLCNSFDHEIPWYVHSHRRNTSNSSGRYLFQRGVQAWKDFTETVRAALPGGQVLLSTDLVNYFDHINLDLLRRQLCDLIPGLNVPATAKNEIRNCVTTLSEHLGQWSYNEKRGLPQNRDASSFLANIYMRPVDLEMRKRGYEYYRYMDDIKIICRDQLDARRALQILAIELRKLDLAVNSKKTKIAATQRPEEVAECLDEASPELDALNAIWSTKRREMIARSFPALKALTLKCLRSDGVDSRAFRFCVTRLMLLAGCQEFATPAGYFDEITDLMIDALLDAPATTDQFVKYLERVPLSDQQMSLIADFICDAERNFYDWQCYRIWLFFGRAKYSSNQLIATAKAALSDRSDCAYRAGASIYLGAMGTEQDRLEIVRNFHSLDTYMGQRAALLAVHELPFSGEVKQALTGRVREDLIGVYRNSKQTAGKYYTELEPISITRIVDTERDYA